MEECNCWKPQTEQDNKCTIERWALMIHPTYEFNKNNKVEDMRLLRSQLGVDSNIEFAPLLFDSGCNRDLACCNNKGGQNVHSF